MAEQRVALPLSTLDRFIRFSTDAAGIERMLRMVQAIVMVLLAHEPALTRSGFFGPLVSDSKRNSGSGMKSGGVEMNVLGALRGRVALARRFLRMFRFLECFRAAYLVYVSFYAAPAPMEGGAGGDDHVASNGHGGTKASESNEERIAAAQPAQPAQPAEPKRTCNCKHNHNHNRKSQDPTKIPTETWLDIFSRTFNAMYLLLETLMLVDALELPGFTLWGTHWGPTLHVEGQRFWFFALLCGIGAALIKLAKLVRYAPVVRVPQAGEGWGWGWGDRKAESELADWEQMRDKMRRMVWHRRETKKAWRRELRTKGWRTARRCVADVLDLAVPGVVVGWVNVSSGTVGLLMAGSTYLTGLEIWERF
ncbi:hypothetical protein BD289DRAFT_485290 [Coniella lustricola]|uniref:Peroxisomal biogenesis factor 11 n=1 Tax=Coniella lustricola TaxID=2025994 RepID=A0A2T2ZZ36_9PEZI|nr:hypothetical protein BD289DRAFT_485290 [Coniella lustricola]